jgi:hypothetical protein
VSLGLKSVGVPMDDKGIVADELDRIMDDCVTPAGLEQVLKLSGLLQSLARYSRYKHKQLGPGTTSGVFIPIIHDPIKLIGNDTFIVHRHTHRHREYRASD